MKVYIFKIYQGTASKTRHMWYVYLLWAKASAIYGDLVYSVKKGYQIHLFLKDLQHASLF